MTELTWPVKGLLIVDLLIRVQNSVQWQARLATVCNCTDGDGAEPYAMPTQLVR
jgi:hypothetical protein